MMEFPVIDLLKTGENIRRLREERGIPVKEIQRFLGFEEPRAIYLWQKGVSLPSVDHLCALSALLGVSMNEILVLADKKECAEKAQVHRSLKRLKNIRLLLLAAAV